MESPIKDIGYRNKVSVIGFIDMKVEYSVPELGLSLGDATIRMQRSDCPAVPSDLYAPTYFSWRDRTAMFEIKTEIRSLGALLRQMNLYKSHERARDWFVVSPDTRYRDNLIDQGIRFIEYIPDSPMADKAA
jgi:hypothetical protein